LIGNKLNINAEVEKESNKEPKSVNENLTLFFQNNLHYVNNILYVCSAQQNKWMLKN